MNEAELGFKKTSKLFGPTRESYDDLTKGEKCVVTHCFKNRYPSTFCSKCRFKAICYVKKQ